MDGFGGLLVKGRTRAIQIFDAISDRCVTVAVIMLAFIDCYCLFKMTNI